MEMLTKTAWRMFRKTRGPHKDSSEAVQRPHGNSSETVHIISKDLTESNRRLSVKSLESAQNFSRDTRSKPLDLPENIQRQYGDRSTGDSLNKSNIKFGEILENTQTILNLNDPWSLGWGPLIQMTFSQRFPGVSRHS